MHQLGRLRRCSYPRQDRPDQCEVVRVAGEVGYIHGAIHSPWEGRSRRWGSYRNQPAGPRTIHYEAATQESFPGDAIPSVATIARLLSAVGQVDPAPKKRPKSSYIPFVRATAMALWQLDAFECRLADGQTVTVYQVIDDATRYDVGTWARCLDRWHTARR